MNAEPDSSTPKQSLVQTRRMWEGGPLRQWSEQRVTSNWVKHRDGWAGDLYLPAVPLYCDDVEFFTSNPWAGELRAIREFNNANSLRKISRDLTLPGGPERPVFQKWYQQMSVAHILDHPGRNRGIDQTRTAKQWSEL